MNPNKKGKFGLNASIFFITIGLLINGMTNQEKLAALPPHNPIGHELLVKPKDQKPTENDVIRRDVTG